MSPQEHQCENEAQGRAELRESDDAILVVMPSDHLIIDTQALQRAIDLAVHHAERGEIIEVQSGSYLGEDDIVRFDDTYGRCGPQSPAPRA